MVKGGLFSSTELGKLETKTKFNLDYDHQSGEASTRLCWGHNINQHRNSMTVSELTSTRSCAGRVIPVT